MARKISGSLSAKAFLWIAGLLILCSLLIYGIVMRFLPQSYTVVASGRVEEEIERLAHIRDFPESYAFEFSPWNEILGYEIDARNACDVGAAELCAAVIWEMTFYGFEEAKVEAERQKLDEALREAEEICKLPEEEQGKHFIPAEEVFAELGLPKQSEEEKQELHRKFCREVLTNNLRTYQALQKYVVEI